MMALGDYSNRGQLLMADDGQNEDEDGGLTTTITLAAKGLHSLGTQDALGRAQIASAASCDFGGIILYKIKVDDGRYKYFKNQQIC
jgi:hypothetical protein